MSIIGSNILAGASGSGVSAYEIEQSLRFNSADSAYLNRTPGSAGNRKTWTWSLWLKRAGLGATNMIWSCGGSNSAADTDYLETAFNSSDQLIIATLNGQRLISTQRFRDTSAWYHFVFKLDTTQATVSDRLVVYLNGSEITNWDTDTRSTYFAQNSDQGVGRTEPHQIGRQSYSGSSYTNVYLAEVNFIDGSALDHEDFGELDNNGVWRPIEYTGSYTGNSFYLKFASGDGTDSSGLTNTWTANNFTTSGTGTDVMSDTPTTNWCTLNPLDVEVPSGTLTIDNGNLDTTSSSTNSWKSGAGTLGVSSGKWYWEATLTNESQNNQIGVINAFQEMASLSNYFSAESDGWALQSNDNLYNGGSTGERISDQPVTGDIIGVALDADSGKLWFAVNNSWQSLQSGQSAGDPAAGTNAIFTNLSGYTLKPAYALYSAGDKTTFNFGQRAFAYTPPTGYKALNTANLPAPDIADGSDYFNTVLYTGNNSTQTISTNFSPDFVWAKNRDTSGYHHDLYDRVRGDNLRIFSSQTAAETTGYLQFGTNSFSLTSGGGINANGEAHVAWHWFAGGSVSADNNTDGSITSTVSANPSAGFSIVSYTGNATNSTVGHGLGVVPKMVIVKNRDAGGAWYVFHDVLATDTWLLLASTAGTQSGYTTIWNSQRPSSSTFSIGTSGGVNESGNDFIAYCFAEVEGYSKFGSYTGNGSSDGVFIHLGFKPSFFLLKATSVSGESWSIFDSARDPNNFVNRRIMPNNANAEEEYPSSGSATMDFLSNGVKLRASNTAMNGSGVTFIYAAFAENPFGGSGVSPATAR